MKIICFGDSITRGVTLQGTRLRIVKGTFPKLLQQHFENIEIINKGVFNDNSFSLLERFNKHIVSENPNIVFIEIGGNDCVFDWQAVADSPLDEHTATVPLDTFIENVTQICRNIQNIHVQPVLLALPPLDAARYYTYLTTLFGNDISHWICRTGGISEWHGRYNEALVKLSDTLHVPMIDTRTPFFAHPMDTVISNDGIHPTAKGYALIAETIAKAVPALIEAYAIKH